MEAQGLSEGSLRNSHRETHAIRRKPAPAQLQELAGKLVEQCSTDLILRQRLDPTKMEGVLKRGEFFVMENEGRGEPGFLVFLPGKPAVYYQLRRGKGPLASTLRLRVSASLGEGGGSVLVATLDDVLHSLRLEDVWMWRGQALAGSTPYSRRREKLKEFVERHWIPDARLLGGIFTKISEPMSLAKFSERIDWSSTSSVEFIPEQAGRRRLVWHLEAQQRAAEAHAGLKGERFAERERERLPHQERNTVVGRPAAAAAPAVASAPAALQRRARAVPVDKMPDVYDLFGEDGFPISRASVQQFALSQQLRVAAKDSRELWVQARWRSEFGGYEITGLDTAGC